MNTIHFKKPDIKGKIEKLRHLSREDLKESAKKRKERRQRILEERKKNYIYYQLNTSVIEEIMMWIAQFSNQQEKPDAAKPDEPDGRA